MEGGGNLISDDVFLLLEAVLKTNKLKLSSYFEIQFTTANQFDAVTTLHVLLAFEKFAEQE